MAIKLKGGPRRGAKKIPTALTVRRTGAGSSEREVAFEACFRIGDIKRTRVYSCETGSSPRRAIAAALKDATHQTSDHRGLKYKGWRR